jgi:FecR-like protein
MGGRTDGRAVCLFLALVSLVVFFAPPIACAQQIVGTVSQLSGTAQIQRGSLNVAVAQGTAIQLHDRLATSVNSSATVTLASGITLTLAEHTNLTFDQNVTTAGTGRTQLNLVEGGLRSVVPVLLRTQAFEIHTPNAVTAVRGTDFDTTYTEGVVRPGYEGCQRYTDVRVREGVVAVSNLANPTQVVDIEAGYETTVPCELPPLNAGPLGIAGAAGPGEAGGRAGGGGGGSSAAGGAAAAAVGFSAPPPGGGTSAPPPPPPPMPPLSPVTGP